MDPRSTWARGPPLSEMIVKSSNFAGNVKNETGETRDRSRKNLILKFNPVGLGIPKI